MSDSITRSRNSKNRNDTVELSGDSLTSRGGLALFVRYLRAISLYPHLERLFGSIRKNCRGQPIGEIFKQLLCFFADGTSRHLVFFGTLKEDEGYTKAMESEAGQMLSSHAVKRFFREASFSSLSVSKSIDLSIHSSAYGFPLSLAGF